MAGGSTGPKKPTISKSRTLRRGGEGEPEQPDNVAMLDPQGKGDGGGHQQHRDVDDEQGLDVESHHSVTLVAK